jgi:putative membrane protein
MKPTFKVGLIVLYCTICCAAYAQTATPEDRAFVAKVSQGGMFEVAAGRLAMTKGSSQDIRDFGTAEVHDHTLVGAKLKAISAQVGVSIATVLNTEFSSKLQHLSLLSGPMFDQAYLSEMAALHDADGAAFAKEASEGGTSAYRAFGAETHRIVQRHIGAIRAVPANKLKID